MVPHTHKNAELFNGVACKIGAMLCQAKRSNNVQEERVVVCSSLECDRFCAIDTLQLRVYDLAQHHINLSEHSIC